MAEIGRRGFQTFAERYFGGDREQAASWLRVRAYESRAESLAERELQRRMEAGEKVACLEIPVYSYGDEEPFRAKKVLDRNR